jgi:hypothetical protein
MDETKQFTNRELYMLVDKNNEVNQLQHAALLESIQNFHGRTEETLKIILAQTTKTNGRVTKNEENISKLNEWKNYIAGGIALFCLIGLPMLWILVQDVRADGDLIKSHIAQTK